MKLQPLECELMVDNPTCPTTLHLPLGVVPPPFVALFPNHFFILGFEVEKDSHFRAHGRYLILQRDESTGGKGGALSIAEVSVFCPKGPYVPGTPGGPWTDEEVLIVKEKVQYMIDPQNAKSLYRDTERFPKIVNEVWGNVWKPHKEKFHHWRNKTFWRSDMMLAPTTRKLIQLAFHDCLKNVDSEGNHFGGCDGCLNWVDIQRFF